MNYNKIYTSIVSSAKLQDRRKFKKTNPEYVYYEKHHILPKCLGGNNDKENLVILTPKEHLICHLLLVKIYPSNVSLIRAAILLGSDRYGNRINAKQYEWLRIRFSSFTSPVKGQISKRKGKTFGPNRGRGRKIENTESYLGRTPWNKGIKTGVGGPSGSQEKVTCTICGLTGGIKNMKRYHFENCQPYKFGKQCQE